MDQRPPNSTSVPSLRSNDAPVSAYWANIAQLLRTAYLGPRLRNRMMFGSVRILRQIRRKDRKDGGYHYKTTGMAAEYLRLLQNPHTRAHSLRIARIAPENFSNPEKFGSDEDIARAMALAKIVQDLEKRFDDEFYKKLPRLIHECRLADAMAKLDDDEADRHADRALDHLEAAIDAVVNDAARYVGRCLERDFIAAKGDGGWRPADLVAQLTTDIFGPRRGLNERQARHLCGWD